MLRKAVANDGFDLHFQPIHRGTDGGLAGFEALLRLPRKGGAPVSPAVFVPLAERMGLITQIGDWVLRRACEIAATWPSHLTVSVNLSPVQFEDGEIARTTAAALAASRAGGGAARAGDHRGPAAVGHGTGDAPARRAEGARRAHRHGRFRHRLFEPQLSLALPLRQDQDRPVLRARPARRRPALDLGHRHHGRARPLARHDRHRRGGGDEGAGSIS